MRLLVVILVVVLAGSTPAAQFRGLSASEVAGSFPYSLSSPVISVSTISGDGSTIGGNLTQTGVEFICLSFDCYNLGFVWSLADDRHAPLGELPLIQNGGTASPKSVSALSFDGATVLASYEYRHYESAIANGGKVRALRDNIELGQWLHATAMSSDASVVVGTLGDAPFRWSEAEGLQDFSGLDPELTYSPAGISGDGSTIVMNARPRGPLDLSLGADQWGRNAIVWNSAGNLLELEPVNGVGATRVEALSNDGNTAVGISLVRHEESERVYALPTAWRQGETIPLSDEPSFSASVIVDTTPNDVSADGNTTVGTRQATSLYTDVYFPPEAVLWRGDRNYFLQSLLAEEYGLAEELVGWQLHSATAISDNGQVIAGMGIDPDGNQSAWIAVLSVPEPGAGGILLSFACFTLLRNSIFVYRR